MFDCLAHCLFSATHNRMNTLVCQMAIKVFKSLWSNSIVSFKNILGMALNIAVRVIWIEHVAQC